MNKYYLDSEENLVRKGENAGNRCFLCFPQGFHGAILLLHGY